MTLIAVYPESNITFNLLQSVSGKGFVNVHNDLSTSVPSFLVTNCVYVTAKIKMGVNANENDTESLSMQKCLSVAIKDIGTKLETREHGSGDYRTEEMAKMRTENMSIESQKSVSAIYIRPTSSWLAEEASITPQSGLKRAGARMLSPVLPCMRLTAMPPV